MNCMQDCSFNCESDGRKRSVLGALFGTVHHDNVVRLQSQVWCPLEETTVTPTSAEAANASASSSGTVDCAELRRDCQRILEDFSEQQLEEAKAALYNILNNC